ncbi:U4/U6.U5 small nuclear ribonucleoprotein 27 kDa protein [Linum grandiflorum]
MNEDGMEMMKMLGIPIGFDSTKGKLVEGANVSGVRAVSKRQPRQYVNRRGGFNQPLPTEKNQTRDYRTWGNRDGRQFYFRR